MTFCYKGLSGGQDQVKERLDLHDTVQDIVMKLAEGNPGAMTVCMKILELAGKIDPEAMPLSHFLNLDHHHIYGPRIWMLYRCAGAGAQI